MQGGGHQEDLDGEELRGDCAKYVQPGDESLAKQILVALLKTSSAANEPAKF